MAINVLDGQEASSVSQGKLVGAWAAYGAVLAGAVTQPVNSVNGVLDREFGTYQVSMVGSYVSPPSSGTTHLVPNGTTMAAVRALNLSFGDTVSFEKGATFIVTGSGDRLLCESGITYNSYGTGTDPVIDATGSGLSRFIGVVEAQNCNNVTIDGIQITCRGTDPFLCWIRHGTTNTTVKNCTFYDTPGGGLVFTQSDSSYVYNCELFDVNGNPHETLTIGSASNVLVEYCHMHNNGHAALNAKGGSSNVEVRFCELTYTQNDPLMYVERATDVRYHHNICHTSDPNISTTAKPLLSVAIEGLGTGSTRYNRRIEYDHNVIMDALQVSMKMSIKFSAYVGVNPLPSPIFDDINVHHNTFYNGALLDGTDHMLNLTDNRDQTGGTAADPNDWTDIRYDNNILYQTNGGKAIRVNGGIPFTSMTNNLFKTGDPSSTYGSNSITTNSIQFTDTGSRDLRLVSGSPGTNAATDGADVGANLNPTLVGLR